MSYVLFKQVAHSSICGWTWKNCNNTIAPLGLSKISYPNFFMPDSTQADAAFCHRKWIKWLCSTCLPIHFSSGSHKWFVEGHIADHIFPKWDDTTFTWSKNGSSHLLVQRSSRPLLMELNQQKYLGLVLNLNGRVEKRSETKKWGLYITSHHLNHPFLVIFIVGSFRYLLLHLHFFS